MVVAVHGIQTFKVVVVVVVVFDVLVPTSAYPPIIFGQAVCPNILKCQPYVLLVLWNPFQTPIVKPTHQKLQQYNDARYTIEGSLFHLYLCQNVVSM